MCESLKRLIETKNLIESAGIPVPIVSCGGSSDFSIAAKYPEITEIQAGSYLLMDSSYVPFAPEFKPTLTILGTVISKTPGERLVVDAGFRAMSGENGLPSIKDAPGVRPKALHIEHTIIEITDPAVSIEVGDKIEILVRFLIKPWGCMIIFTECGRERSRRSSRSNIERFVRMKGRRNGKIIIDEPH